MLNNKMTASIENTAPRNKEAKLFTDAGVREGKASIACIISLPDQTKKKFVALIDFTTSIEAEALAALFGFIILQSILNPSTLIRVMWYTDCLTLLQKSELPLAHSASKKSFKDILLKRDHQLFSNLEITPSFIKAHSGKKENEQCDRACKWLCTDQDRLIKKYSGGLIGKLAKLEPEKAWFFIDLRGMSDSFDRFNKILTDKLLSSEKAHV